jgi:hypothetical protein
MYDLTVEPNAAKGGKALVAKVSMLISCFPLLWQYLVINYYYLVVTFEVNYVIRTI